MTARDRERWRRLVTMAQTLLGDPARQSADVWRGDLRAIVAADRELAQLHRDRFAAHVGKLGAKVRSKKGAKIESQIKSDAMSDGGDGFA